MKENELRQPVEQKDAALKCETSPPHRVLVVDDELVIRQLNTKMLIDAGYHVDAAADGAAAWNTLQRNSYDLLITDNTMPKVSGVELIGKVRAAGIPLLIIMATGALPEEEFARHPQLQPAATLHKPYTLAEFLGTVKNVLCPAVSVIMLQLCLATTINAQEVIQPPAALRIISLDSTRPNAAQPHAVRPHAVVLTVVGKCDCSDDGVTFTPLARGHILEQGAIVRTGGEGWTDLLFGRTGTTVRLQPGTEIRLEKIAMTIKEGRLAEHALLDLRAGRVFTVVRSKVAGNTMEIKNAAGRSLMEGSGAGRYIITADGTYVSAVGSVVPIELMGKNGTIIITAGQQFTKQDGKMFLASTNLWGKDFIQLDELQASTEEPVAGKPSPKL